MVWQYSIGNKYNLFNHNTIFTFSLLCVQHINRHKPLHVCVLQITDLVQENALLKGKLVTLNETLASTQLESKASRETIMRLVSEMNRDQKVTTKYTSEVENLRMVSCHLDGLGQLAVYLFIFWIGILFLLM